MKNNVQPVIIRSPSPYESQASKKGRGRDCIIIINKSCIQSIIQFNQRKKRDEKKTRITSSKRVRDDTQVDLEKAICIHYLSRCFHYPAL